ncbi:hypothetical protein GDO86_002806 [Hymenochirus boettgeri]|uniref:Ig-like domain-containing protein n=1 Tax=Hymenochirus boettgeri TaxID=247094 RepID=A0A8T2K6M7_9PIPI|nr:hypothetical protein GDO86_002806 [Hymenochirus boettgeri]
MQPAPCLVFLGYFAVLCYKESLGVHVSSSKDKVEVDEFGETVLSCDFKLQKKQTPRLEWKKVVSANDISFIFFNDSLAASLQGRATMMESNIRILNTTRADSGLYRCEVTAPLDDKTFHEVSIELKVWVAPGIPLCDVPASAMSGTAVELKCRESEGYPASTYQWYKNGVLLAVNPSLHARVTNSSYTVNSASGTLQFNTVTKMDTGDYYCEANNGIGKTQKCAMRRLQVDDLNVAGIIAGVVVVALVMLFCGFGVFYAHRKGYLSKGNSSGKDGSHKAASQKDNEFKHTKSFVI